MEIFLVNALLLDLVLNLWLLVVVGVPVGLFAVLLDCLRHELKHIELESLGQHFV